MITRRKSLSLIWINDILHRLFKNFLITCPLNIPGGRPHISIDLYWIYYYKDLSSAVADFVPLELSLFVPSVAIVGYTNGKRKYLQMSEKVLTFFIGTFVGNTSFVTCNFRRMFNSLRVNFSSKMLIWGISHKPKILNAGS